MPATATYRIGPSDFFTPNDLAADAETLQAQILALDPLIVDAAPMEFFDQWTHFETAWRTFYEQHFGGFVSNLLTAFNDANRDDLIRYETQFASFEQQAKEFGVGLVAPVGPSSGAKDNIGAQLAAQGLPGTGTLVILAVAAIALIVTWKVLA